MKKLVDKYIYELEKGKKYRIFIRKGGSNDYFSKVINGTLAQAKKLRDDKLAEIRLNLYNHKESITFLEFCKIYYNNYAKEELSPATIQTDKQQLNRYILPYIKNIPIDKINVLTIQKLMNTMKERTKEKRDKNGNIVKLSPTSINATYRLLRKIFNKAVVWDYINSNPVVKVKTPELSKVEKESYNRKELMYILDLLKHEDIVTECIFTIAICTGLRRAELCGLHINDIDIINNQISVRRAVVWNSEIKELIEKSTKTKGSVRTIPIPLFCIDVIKEYINFRTRLVDRYNRLDINYKNIDNLFLGKFGGILPPSMPTHKWLDFRKKHPEIKDVSLHGLRHSYCSVQMNDNPELSPVDVQKIMGHSQLSTTFGYTHSNEDKSSAIVSVFDNFYQSEQMKKINLNEILSLYLGKLFISKEQYINLINYFVPQDISLQEKIDKIHDYIDSKYSFLNYLNFNNISMNNIFDWLEQNKLKYGDEFMIPQML